MKENTGWYMLGMPKNGYAFLTDEYLSILTVPCCVVKEDFDPAKVLDMYEKRSDA